MVPKGRKEAAEPDVSALAMQHPMLMGKTKKAPGQEHQATEAKTPEGKRHLSKEEAKASWAANERFEISKFKFKFPRARTYELNRARSRLYRSQILQANTRWKALAEICTMHSFAPFSKLNCVL